MATFTNEQVATLHTLMDDHHAIEAMVVDYGSIKGTWLYDSDDKLIAFARIDDLGTVKVFEWMGAIA